MPVTNIYPCRTQVTGEQLTSHGGVRYPLNRNHLVVCCIAWRSGEFVACEANENRKRGYAVFRRAFLLPAHSLQLVRSRVL
jgi:hypothetical protein